MSKYISSCFPLVIISPEAIPGSTVKDAIESGIAERVRTRRDIPRHGQMVQFEIPLILAGSTES